MRIRHVDNNAQAFLSVMKTPPFTFRKRAIVESFRRLVTICTCLMHTRREGHANGSMYECESFLRAVVGKLEIRLKIIVKIGPCESGKESLL